MRQPAGERDQTLAVVRTEALGPISLITASLIRSPVDKEGVRFPLQTRGGYPAQFRAQLPDQCIARAILAFAPADRLRFAPVPPHVRD